jgi:hypothetical protein
VGTLAPELRWDIPLRLLAAVHYLVLSGEAPRAFASWQEFSAALDEHPEHLRRLIAEHAIQTNEVQRSWVLLPCFLEVARRTRADLFDLIELGPSAGLNLVWDRYCYSYEAGTWGLPGARLELEGVERTPVPGRLLRLAPTVRRRIGIDAKPVDVTTDDGARLLKSFVWADQSDRLHRLDRAIEALRDHPPELVEGDFVELLPDLLASRSSDALTLVFQTATLGYLAREERRRLLRDLADAGSAGGMAFVSSVGPREQGATHWGLSVNVWPPGLRELVAEADYHGAWLEWLA